MPDFGTPFSGNSLDKSLSKDELARALRFAIAAEFEAVQLYNQISDAIYPDGKYAEDIPAEKIKKVLKSISDEERVHSGELFALVKAISPDEEKFFNEGIKESLELIKAASDLNQVASELPSEAEDVSKAIQVLSRNIQASAYAFQTRPQQ